MDDLPALPPYPALPMRSEDRLLWNEWAREYARLAVEKERERCAQICESLAITHKFPAGHQWEGQALDLDGQWWVDITTDCAAAIRKEQ